MDKLQELLNEFHLQKWERITIAWPEAEISEKEINALEATLISKKYWFIKWLVDNDKINESKVFSFIDTADKPYEDILCLLALDDEPLDFLASILK